MKRIFIRAAGAVFFFILLLGIIIWARGYRISIAQKNLVSTGILVASSYPDGAKVIINGTLKGATNTTLSLQPGVYAVEIKKEGYVSWSKKITVKGEVVVKADALLFPQNPSLSPITSLGVMKAVFSAQNERIIIISRMQDPKKDGIYLLETSKKTISLFNPLKLLILSSSFGTDSDFENSEVSFSPDGKQSMLSFFQVDQKMKQKLLTASYLISTEEKTTDPFVVTQSKETIETVWQKEEEKKIAKILEIFKDPILQIASDSMRIVSFSPDDSKILYQAKNNFTLPPIIKPPLIGTNQTTEERSVAKDRLYVYDKKEDKNYLLDNLQFSILNFQSISNDQISKEQNTSSRTPFIENCKLQIENCILWYPDSTHLVINEGKTIAVADYDGENKRTVYSGPYEKDFFALSSDGKILVLVNLNPSANTLPDVYAVGIR